MNTERITNVAAVCFILLAANLVGWLIYDRGYSDGARGERTRCSEMQEQERQLRHEARLDALTEAADKAGERLESSKSGTRMK